MKYVMTKDGKIYEESKVFVIKENDIKVVLLGIDKELVERTRGKSWNCGTNVVVKEANDIKDLCDAFVVREKPFYLQPYLWKESVEKLFSKNILKNIKSLSIEVYGCIWVFDRNGAPTLKPVTKLNEKGDLKLL